MDTMKRTKTISRPVTPDVAAIGRMHIEGNVTPLSWYHNIKTKDGKPDYVAIMILSDIVYWYRPTEVRDEESGRLVGYERKFSADLLQRGYGEIAEMFGISKEQARDACHRLRDAEIIRIEIRHGVRYGNSIANNVVYLAPNPPKLAEITYRVQVGAAKIPSPPSQDPPRGVFGVDTNTLTTTETTTNNFGANPAPKTPSSPPSSAVEYSPTQTTHVVRDDAEQAAQAARVADAMFDALPSASAGMPPRKPADGYCPELASARAAEQTDVQKYATEFAEILAQEPIKEHRTAATRMIQQKWFRENRAAVDSRLRAYRGSDGEQFRKAGASAWYIYAQLQRDLASGIGKRKTITVTI